MASHLHDQDRHMGGKKMQHVMKPAGRAGTHAGKKGKPLNPLRGKSGDHKKLTHKGQKGGGKHTAAVKGAVTHKSGAGHTAFTMPAETGGKLRPIRSSHRKRLEGRKI